MVQAATGQAMTGTVGRPADKIVVLVAANTNVAGLAGLFNLDWLVNGYQPDVSALGGAIVFELRQSQRTGEFIVRALYVAQTMDQLRSREPLTLAAPPAKVPVFIPGLQHPQCDLRLSSGRLCAAGAATDQLKLRRYQ